MNQQERLDLFADWGEAEGHLPLRLDLDNLDEILWLLSLEEWPTPQRPPPGRAVVDVVSPLLSDPCASSSPPRRPL